MGSLFIIYIVVGLPFHQLYPAILGFSGFVIIGGNGAAVTITMGRQSVFINPRLGNCIQNSICTVFGKLLVMAAVAGLVCITIDIELQRFILIQNFDNLCNGFFPVGFQGRFVGIKINMKDRLTFLVQVFTDLLRLNLGNSLLKRSFLYHLDRTARIVATKLDINIIAGSTADHIDLNWLVPIILRTFLAQVFGFLFKLV